MPALGLLPRFHCTHLWSHIRPREATPERRVGRQNPRSRGRSGWRHCDRVLVLTRNSHSALLDHLFGRWPAGCVAPRLFVADGAGESSRVPGAGGQSLAQPGKRAALLEQRSRRRSHARKRNRATNGRGSARRGGSRCSAAAEVSARALCDVAATRGVAAARDLLGEAARRREPSLRSGRRLDPRDARVGPLHRVDRKLPFARRGGRSSCGRAQGSGADRRPIIQRRGRAM
jgi:hypothetical protein